MGDRANFGFIANGQTVYLYSHWGGSGMLGTLAEALQAARPRWNDPAYGTRIAISSIIGQDYLSETGFGLTVNELCDNEHSIPVVDFENNTVTLRDRDSDPANICGKTPKFTMTLDGFVTKFIK